VRNPIIVIPDGAREEQADPEPSRCALQAANCAPHLRSSRAKVWDGGGWRTLGLQRIPDLQSGYSYRSALTGFALATEKDCQDTVTHAISTPATAASTKVQAESGAW
jgi:hypothetical protein